MGMKPRHTDKVNKRQQKRTATVLTTTHLETAHTHVILARNAITTALAVAESTDFLDIVQAALDQINDLVDDLAYSIEEMSK